MFREALGIKCSTENGVRNINVSLFTPVKAASRAAAETLGPWIPAFAGVTNNLLIFHDSFPVRFWGATL
jgi:hypothetical protein